MKGIVWEQAPADATHFHPGNDKYTPHWYKKGYFCILGFEVDGWIKDVFYTDISEHIPRPSAPWNGNGPPPVGTVCEYRVGNGVWFPCTITYLLRVPNGTGWELVANCPHLGGEQLIDAEECEIRPIKTQAQIDAEERIAAINYMEIDAGMCATAFDGDPEARIWIENLIDKGWRKGESK